MRSAGHLSAPGSGERLDSHLEPVLHGPQVELAKALVEKSFADRVFFSNTGAEAIEATLKFARKYHQERGIPSAPDLSRSAAVFHGRTMGSLALTRFRKSIKRPFARLCPALRLPSSTISTRRAPPSRTKPRRWSSSRSRAKGGIIPGTDSFLRGLREICDQRGALLIFDEIQCRMGRTGKLWAHEYAGVKPDMMAVAKPLAAGLPIGAALVTEAVATSLHPGEHGTTFGGGPLVTSDSAQGAQPDRRPPVSRHGP